MNISQNELRPQAAMPNKHSPRTVFLYCPAARELRQHEWATHMELAKRLAALMGWEFGGRYDPEQHYSVPTYFVPSDTLLCSESAALGVDNHHQLFGGVVPFSFVATKIITHGVPQPSSPAPPGWAPTLGERLREHVLPGFSAFTPADVKRAAAQLFERGRVRLKLPDGVGGVGQFVIASMEELDSFLEQVDSEQLAQKGLVAETNLSQVTTYSVGQCLVGDLLVTYCGTQQATANNHGSQVYGGSALTVVRGDFDRLLQLPLDDTTRTAISQARAYHQAALTCYPDTFVSRANYDVGRGMDDRGQWHSGVLEQSWRIGGASAAEVVALEAFDADASLEVVCASTTERYGADFIPPDKSYVYYRDVDDKVGPLTKYAQIANYAYIRQ